MKIQKKKKRSRGTALRKICNKIGADWKVFRYRNYDTTSVKTKKRSQNDKTNMLLVIS